MNLCYDDHPVLEQLLQDHFAAVVASMDPKLSSRIACLALGGGYGRGEGGVYLEKNQPPRLFNDLDYFLFSDDPHAPALRDWIREIERSWSDLLQIDVEIKALPPSFLETCATNMMASDLVAGHHMVYGPEDYIKKYLPQCDPSQLPVMEASRLLWNRGSGLFFARCRIEREQDPAFIYRNHQKLKLGLGDAYLCAAGQYHDSVLERGKRLAALNTEPINDTVKALHAEGVEFKLHPHPCPLTFEELAKENAELTRLWATGFLHIESERLALPFNSLENYATFSGKIGQDVPWWKPPLLALRDLSRYRSCMRPIWDYPRYSLHRALACLNDIDRYPRPLATLDHFMKHPNGFAEDGMQWEPIYESWWRRYS